jgi:malate dehydrogenase (oxaloacetate-decarboxylating)(NADP+)
MTRALYENAIEYHRLPKPGKIEVVPIQGLTIRRDLALAYKVAPSR